MTQQSMNSGKGTLHLTATTSTLQSAQPPQAGFPQATQTAHRWPQFTSGNTQPCAEMGGKALPGIVGTHREERAAKTKF